MFIRTDDPVMDARRYYTQMDNERAKLPKCAYCGEHIQDEYCSEIDGVLYHEECATEKFRKSVDDFILSE